MALQARRKRLKGRVNTARNADPSSLNGHPLGTLLDQLDANLFDAAGMDALYLMYAAPDLLDLVQRSMRDHAMEAEVYTTGKKTCECSICRDARRVLAKMNGAPAK